MKMPERHVSQPLPLTGLHQEWTVRRKEGDDCSPVVLSVCVLGNMTQIMAP